MKYGIEKVYEEEYINALREYLFGVVLDYKGEKPILFQGIDLHLLKNILFGKYTTSDGQRYYGIIDEYIPLYKKINFSNVSFDNVKVSGIDFTDWTGVQIDQETIFNNDLEGTNLSGVTIISNITPIKQLMKVKTNIIDS